MTHRLESRLKGQPPKTLEEFIGRANSQTDAVRIARMVSPSGWSEPEHTPEFDEFTVVLRGELQIETCGGVLTVSAGQAVIVSRGEWVRYSTPAAEGAEYIAVYIPAFSPATVHRDTHPPLLRSFTLRNKASIFSQPPAGAWVCVGISPRWFADRSSTQKRLP